MAKIDKLIIADEMLEASIIEYLDNANYFASFNLAGVAEEIYGKYVRVKKLQDSQRDNIEVAIKISKKLGAPEISIKEWKAIATHHKNSVKHLDSENDRYIELEPKDEARLMIADALSNHIKLGREETPEIKRFNNYGREWSENNA